jgi:hypothetical protein
MYPEDSLHSVCQCTDWWKRTDDTVIRRGDLIRVHVPYVVNQPFKLTPVGRKTATDFDKADYRVEPYDASAPTTSPTLPVAGLSLQEKEIFYAYRAKMRPAIVLSTGGEPLSRSDRVGTARWRSSHTFLGLPTSRASGWKRGTVTRIRHCEWSQYMWDILPDSQYGESVFLFGQMQSFSSDYRTYRKSGYRLTDKALDLMDDWLLWYFYGDLSNDGDLRTAREILLNP